MVVTNTQLKVAGSVVLLLAVAFAVKMIWFPSVAETFFQLNYQDLEKAPAHVLILRPTHFANSLRSGCMAVPSRSKSGRYDPNQMRMVGRDVSFKEVIAMAYQCPVSSVVLPLFAPTNRYDFLVTVPGKPVERFRTAVKHKLGYTAHWEERDVNVLVLKVQNPNSPGLQPSSAGPGNVTYKYGKLYFQHASLQQIVGMIENQLKQPVRDKTGLTGFYNFALVTQGPGRNRPTDEAFKKSLAEMGLTLDSDSESMQMMVVEEVK
jgi:uncharacterized protein (TIGR03435 family)